MHRREGYCEFSAARASVARATADRDAARVAVPPWDV